MTKSMTAQSGDILPSEQGQTQLEVGDTEDEFIDFNAQAKNDNPLMYRAMVQHHGFATTRAITTSKPRTNDTTSVFFINPITSQIQYRFLLYVGS